MIYASIEDNIITFKECNGDIYECISNYEETLGLIELATTDEYIIYKTDLSCDNEHLILVGNNDDKTLSLKAQYQLAEDFSGYTVIYGDI